MTNKLKITFLGGVGEIGKNMTAFEYGNEIIVVDAGLTFPDDDLPGIDIVVPDISYLVANKEKIKAIFKLMFFYSLQLINHPILIF